MLYVEQNEVDEREQFFKPFVGFGIIRSGSVYRHVYARFFHQTAKFDEKVELQKRFAAAYGKSASFAEVVFVFENFRGDSACGNHPRAVGFSPGIGIVTIFASEIAPL